MTSFAIQTFALTHDFGREPVLRELSLMVPQGVVCALLGRNGSGKTTLIRLLLGILKPQGGRAAVLGMDPTREAITIRTRIGYVPQESDFDPQMTVAETLRFVSRFYPGRWREEEVNRNLVRFELATHKQVGQLSGGQKGHLALVVALASDPELLILDEPTAGLDAVVRRSFQAAVIDFMSRPGRTVLLSSHQLNEVERLADQVAILAAGRLAVAASVEELKDRVARLKGRFPSDLPRERIPGLICCHQLGEFFHLAAWADGEPGRDQLVAALAAEGARDLTFEEASLESIFVDLVGDSGGQEHA